MQRYLYNKCIQNDNIISAIKEVNKLPSSFTAGPDGISLKNKIDQDIAIKEVKLRLRRYKRVNSFVKDNIHIINLYDRYAQQAVYRVINSIIESKMSIHNYFKTKVSVKIPVSKIANIIMKAYNTYIIEIDFKKCFNYISLDRALKALKELGINDYHLLITIKHLMWISKEYNGIGINQNTVLGSLLCNCYLNQLDQFMEYMYEINDHDSHRQRDYKAHKENWINWLKKRNKKIECRYYRYFNTVLILTTIKTEQLYIWSVIKDFISAKIDINFITYKIRQNKADFLGFHLMKGITNSTWIKIKDEQRIYNEIKKIKIVNHKNIVKFKKYLIKILNYYDIVNDMGNLLNKINCYLFCQCRKYYIKQIKGNNNNIFLTSKNEIIDIWKMRRDTKDSFKTYLINSSWLREREQLINYEQTKNEWYIYKWTLFTKQKGKDKITGQYLKAKNCVIHHVIPRKLNGTDEIDNLILIDKETHKKLHYSSEEELQTDPNYKSYAKYRKHLLPSLEVIIK